MSRRFFNGESGICGLAKANTDSAFFVTDNDSDAKVEPAASGHNTRHAADADKFLRKFAPPFVATSSSSGPSGTSVATAPSALKSFFLWIFDFLNYSILDRQFNYLRYNDLCALVYFCVYFCFGAHNF